MCAALAVALAGGVALAQDAAVKKPRRPQGAASPAAAASPATSDDGGNVTGAAPIAPDASIPAAPATAGSGLSPPLALRGPQGLGAAGATPVLRSAVRSRWSAPATIASRGESACRSQCAASRIACLAPGVDEEAGRCNAGWTSCLSTCDGLGYARAPAPNP